LNFICRINETDLVTMIRSFEELANGVLNLKLVAAGLREATRHLSDGIW
jgi:hypothetical protein